MTFWELVDKKLTIFVVLALASVVTILYGAFSGNQLAVGAGMVLLIFTGLARLIKHNVDMT